MNIIPVLFVYAIFIFAFIFLPVSKNPPTSHRDMSHIANPSIECGNSKKDTTGIYFLEEMRHDDGDLFYFVDGSTSVCHSDNTYLDDRRIKTSFDVEIYVP